MADSITKTSRGYNKFPYQYQRYDKLANENMDLINSDIDNLEANSLTPTQKTALTGGGNADAYHQHQSLAATGFILPYHKRTAPAGWLMGTEGYDIGDLGSGADYEGDIYKNLYIEYWTPATTTGNDAFTISSAKGASAEADWNAGKTITIDLSKGYIKPDKCDVRSVGQYQADAFQAHKHTSANANSVLTNDVNFGWFSGIGTSGGKSLENIMTGYSTDGTNGTPRTASETRPKNLSFPMIIKL